PTVSQGRGTRRRPPRPRPHPAAPPARRRPRRGGRGVMGVRPSAVRVAVRTVELTEPLHPLADLVAYTSVQIFGLWSGRPIGSVEVANHGHELSEGRVAEAIARGLGREVLAAMVSQGYG